MAVDVLLRQEPATPCRRNGLHFFNGQRLHT
jgi:hypothetical protein